MPRPGLRALRTRARVTPAEKLAVRPMSVTETVMLVLETVPVTVAGLGGFVP